ncbi:MAG: FeoA family protein [Eubacteriales bacterium]
MTLDQLAPGKSAVITRVGGEGTLRLRFLDMGLIPRTTVSMEKIAPMGDPLEIRVRGYELTLRAEDARSIEITEASAENNVPPSAKASGYGKKPEKSIAGGKR